MYLYFSIGNSQSREPATVPVALFTIVTVCAVGRGGPSAEYYYSRSGNEMKADHTVSSFRSYDGEADPQRDNRRRSEILLNFITSH